MQAEVIGDVNNGYATYWTTWADQSVNYNAQFMFYVSAGADVFFRADSGYHQAGCNYYYAADYTDATYEGVTQCSNLSDGYTAEYIAERTGDGNGGYHYVPNFGSETFYGSYAVKNGTGGYVNQFAWQRYQCYDGNGNQMLRADGLSGSNFEDDWLRGN